jgi:hypothetical protein
LHPGGGQAQTDVHNLGIIDDLAGSLDDVGQLCGDDNVNLILADELLGALDGHFGVLSAVIGVVISHKLNSSTKGVFFVPFFDKQLDDFLLQLAVSIGHTAEPADFQGVGTVATGWTEVEGKQRLFSATGALLKGWLVTDAGKMYLQADGSASVGLTQIGQELYCFGEDGILKLGGTVTEGEATYDISPDGTAVLQAKQ